MAVESHSEMKATVGGVISSKARDEEMSSTIARLVKANKYAEAAIVRKDILEERLEEVRKTTSSLEASLKDSVDEVNKLNADVDDLKKAWSVLEETRVVSEADLRSLNERRLLAEQAREDILRFDWMP